MTAPSSGRGRLLFALTLHAAHIAPAVAVWAALGAVLALVPRPVGVVIAVVYALAHGLAETMELPIRPPEIGWAVPSTWLRGRSWAAQALIWGTTLGPGLATRNPYAGMWFVPLLLATTGNPLVGGIAGGLVGLAHGAARAAGILANHRHRESCELPWRMMMLNLRVRRIDGIGLLLAAAMVAVATL